MDFGTPRFQPNAVETSRPLPSDCPVAYVMSRFPKITETFILYEILELERTGVAVEIFPLLRERAAVIHPEAQRLMARVRFLPFLSLAIVAANLRCLARQPGRYLATLVEVLWGTRRSGNFFLGAIGVFPKSICMAEAMIRLKVRHVHAHFANHPALAALVVHRITGLPFSFTAHGSDIHIDQTMLDRKLAAARFATTVCQYNVEFLADRLGQWVRERLTVLHTGTDVDLFAPLDLPRDNRQFSVLSVGALREVKGHRHLVEACRLLAGRGVDIHCRIVGEGPLRPALQRQIKGSGLASRVILTGALARPQIARLMAEADVVVLPSILGSRGDREGIPVSLMEAMACGRPVVSSRQAGIPELIEDGVEGLLCPAGDSKALAAAIQTLAQDHAMRRRMGRAGRTKIERHFDLRRNAAAFAQLLITAGPPTPHAAMCAAPGRPAE